MSNDVPRSDRVKERAGSAGSPPVVVIAASAGGLPSLVSLLESVPPDTGAAFIVAFHRLQGVESHLVEILGRATGMPVAAVVEACRPEPDRVFLCPPAVEVVLDRGVFRVTELDTGRHHWPVDELFSSVARDVGPRSVGVVLSGSGSAGTRGLEEIRAEGGFALAEDPEEAAHAAMPGSAVESGVVDAIAEPARLGTLLSDFLRTLWREPGGAEDSEETLDALFSLLRSHRGRDFRGYKRSTLARRIRRRMALGRHATLESYLERLEDDPAELDALASDLTIKVSGFFRDRRAWEVLDREILGALVAERPAGSELRLWVPACASGEEAYSLSILLAERAVRAGKSFKLKIFATDCDEAALDVARAGCYPEGSVAHLDPGLLARHFVPEGPYYRVQASHRESVVFAHHDLLLDPPFSRMDVVSCRNLLIYLQPAIQEHVLSVLHFALKERGVLFLGSSESVVGPSGLFRPVVAASRVFRRAGPVRLGRVPFPVLGGRHSPGPADRPARAFSERHRVRPASRTAESALLAHFAPAAVLVDDEFNILYFHGEIGRYLAQPKGEPRQTLLAMARAGLRAPLRRVVLQAVRDGVAAKEEVQIWGERRTRMRLTASPAPGATEGEGAPGRTVLVTFEEEVADPTAARVAESGIAESGSEALREELDLKQDELRRTVAALESSNEELRASNEEITSMNEELQATNEELQTSQDELQSLNEELATVNAQLEAKVDELERVTDDLRNVLASACVAMLFLDRELRIRMFTPEATRLFAILPEDVGRPLRGFRPSFEDPELLNDAEEVLGSLVPREAEVRDREGRWYVRRILPYRTEDDRIEGVVVTFQEVTALKRTEQELDTLTRELELRVERRTEHLRLLQDVAVLANSARSMEEAARAVVARVCRVAGWDAGHACWVAEDGSLDSSKGWHLEAEAGAWAPVLQEAADAGTFSPGTGVAGRVAATGEAVWLGNEGTFDDPCLDRLRDPPPGLVVAFPVLVGDEVAGVLEFLAVKGAAPRAGLLELMVDVGTQLGRVVERDRADRKVADLTFQEQQRLGEELHEGLGQQVSALAMLARSLHKKLSDRSAPEVELAAQLEEHLQAARQRVHGLSKGLMPVRLLQRGLPGVLEELAEEVRSTNPIRCELEVDPGLDVRDDRVATALYRIAREAVNNALRHARASRISLRLHRPGEGLLVLEVEDDGKGLPDPTPEGGGLGLRIMRDRAALVHADLTVEPVSESGTRVECRVREGGRHGSP